MRDTPSRDRNPPNFMSGWWHTSRRSLRLDQFPPRELTHMYQISFVYIFALSKAGVLNLLVELYITRVATVIYIYIYNQTGDISTQDGSSLKLVDKFTYLGSSVSSTETDINTRQTEAWIAIDRLSIMWKLDLADKMKHSFFQAAVVSILLYGCTTWTLT